jgi:VanZ family protein
MATTGMVNLIQRAVAHPAMQLLFWLQFAAALTIFTYLTTTQQHIPAGNTDTVLHFTGNFLLFLSTRLAFLKFKSQWFVLAFALIYGSAMEISQHFLPTRYFDTQDLMANWAGVFTGLALAFLVELIFKKLAARQS